MSDTNDFNRKMSCPTVQQTLNENQLLFPCLKIQTHVNFSGKAKKKKGKKLLFKNDYRVPVMPLLYRITL